MYHTTPEREQMWLHVFRSDVCRLMCCQISLTALSQCACIFFVFSRIPMILPRSCLRPSQHEKDCNMHISGKEAASSPIRRIDSGHGGCKLSIIIVGTGAQEAAVAHSSHMGSVSRSTSLFAFSQLLSSVGMRSKSQEFVQTIRGTL